MPNTKRLLARQGTSFTDYIATTAQCCPSRASLLTGQYAHNHGVTSNTVGYPGLVDKGNVLPVWLHRAGYWTIHVGKFLNGYERSAQPDSVVAPGWDQWHTVLGNTAYYSYDLFVNGTVRHRAAAWGPHHTRAQPQAVRLVEDMRQRGTPSTSSSTNGHHMSDSSTTPMGAAAGRPSPSRRQASVSKDEGLPKAPSFNEANMSDKPSFLSSAPKIGPVERAEDPQALALRPGLAPGR